MTKLDEIYNNLLKGRVYGYQVDNVRYPYFSVTLSYDSIHNLFRWRHYGSSANKATKEELTWIIEKIFDMFPEQFAKTYTSCYEDMASTYEDQFCVIGPDDQGYYFYADISRRYMRMRPSIGRYIARRMHENIRDGLNLISLYESK